MQAQGRYLVQGLGEVGVEWGWGSGCPFDTKPTGATSLLAPFPGVQRCQSEIIGYKRQEYSLYANLCKVHANAAGFRLGAPGMVAGGG